MWFGVIATLKNQQTGTIQSNWNAENILYSRASQTFLLATLFYHLKIPVTLTVKIVNTAGCVFVVIIQRKN